MDLVCFIAKTAIRQESKKYDTTKEKRKEKKKDPGDNYCGQRPITCVDWDWDDHYKSFVFLFCRGYH